LLKQFEKDGYYSTAKDIYTKLIEDKEGIKIIKYNRENLYTAWTFWWYERKDIRTWIIKEY